MKWFKRIALFAVTNILVMITLSIVFNIVVSFTGMETWNNYYGYMMVFCLVWGMGGAFISLLISKWMAKKFMGVQIIDPHTSVSEQMWLVSTVNRLARSAGLDKMPEVGIYEAPEINAFATGPTRSNSLVAVSTGLLRSMDKNEIEGVLAHEVSHIANGDMVTMTLIQGVVNAFVMFLARVIAKLLSSQVEERNQHMVYILTTVVLDIVFAILGSIAVSAFSRWREYRADAGGAQLAGRDKMLAGLKKLQAQFAAIAPENNALSAMKISNKPAGVMALFSTHPPLEDRIQRLEQAVI